VKIAATAYIKARSAAEALRIAKEMKYDALELREDMHQEVPITGRRYDDPDLPDISLSPAMTIHGPWNMASAIEDHGEVGSQEDDEE
jgi:hypothetical protein